MVLCLYRKESGKVERKSLIIETSKSNHAAASQECENGDNSNFLIKAFGQSKQSHLRISYIFRNPYNKYVQKTSIIFVLQIAKARGASAGIGLQKISSIGNWMDIMAELVFAWGPQPH